MSRRRESTVPPALDLLEEAVRLLRADTTFVLTHWVGSLPFVVALLYFWADMSRGAFAVERCAPGALALGALFLWMKVFHAVCCVQMAERLHGAAARPWTAGRIFRLVSVQAAVQPAGLLVLGLPVAASLGPALAGEEPALAVILMLVGAGLGLALGWTYAFFQAASVVADRSDGVARRVVRDAGRAALLWPFQNHAGLALLGLFGFFVFVNVTVGLVSAPYLFKLVTGVESEFTLTQWSIFNTTFFSAVAGIAWLLLDPVAKAFYTLRQFHGESVKSGADIRARLRTASRPAAGAVALLVLVLALGAVFGTGELRAAEEVEGAQPAVVTTPARAAVERHPAVAPESLSGAIDEVMARRIYTWREPRERVRPGDSLNTDWLTRAMKSFGNSVDGVLRKVARAVFDFVDWILLRRLRKPSAAGNTGQFDWTAGMDVVLYAVLAAAVAFLLYQGFRVWRSGRRLTVVTTEALPVVPDLRDENVAADQLPEDGWLGMARDLAARGELRLALRALYLASLAGLARREFVTIARHKSNRDYSREVERRARALPEVQGAFGEIVRSFDAAWYGTHAVTPELLQRVEAEVRSRIVTTA